MMLNASQPLATIKRLQEPHQLYGMRCGLLLVALAVAVLPAAAAAAAHTPTLRGFMRDAASQTVAAPRFDLRAHAHTTGAVTHVTLRQPSSPSAVVANFSDAVHQKSGFGILKVWTDDQLPTYLQFYAAGYAEVRACCFGVRQQCAPTVSLQQYSLLPTTPPRRISAQQPAHSLALLKTTRASSPPAGWQTSSRTCGPGWAPAPT